MISRYGKQLSSALTLVLVTCAGIRVAYWLVAPLLPVLGVVIILIGILYMLLRRL